VTNDRPDAQGLDRTAEATDAQLPIYERGRRRQLATRPDSDLRFDEQLLWTIEWELTSWMIDESPDAGRVRLWRPLRALELVDGLRSQLDLANYALNLVWARAGHLPPLLVRDGSASLLPLPAGPLLGAFSSPTYEEQVLHLTPGDRLVLFTDGLVERAGLDIDECLDDLVVTAARTVADIERYADLLLAHVGPNARDDTCLLALHVR